MNCKICQCETPYPNGLCGPCYNLGMRDHTPDGIVVDMRALLSYLGRLPDRGPALERYYTAKFAALKE